MRIHGWICIAVCSVLCKAHLYDDGKLSKDKKYCICEIKVEFTEVPPLELNPAVKIKEPENYE